MASDSRQPPDDGRGVAEDQHLGVRGGVVPAFALVAPAGDDLTAEHQDRADGHLALLGRSAGFVEGEVHEPAILAGGDVRRPRVRQTRPSPPLIAVSSMTSGCSALRQHLRNGLSLRP